MVFHSRLRNLLQLECEEGLTSVVQGKYTNLASKRASIEFNPCASNMFEAIQLDASGSLSLTSFNI